MTKKTPMKAREFMTSQVVACREDERVEDAARVMCDNGFSVLPVVDSEDRLVGIVTESDFVGKEVNVPHALASIKRLFGKLFYFEDIEPIYAQAKKKKLSEVMTKDPVTITPDTTLTSIVNLMLSKKLKRLPVVDQGRIVGMVTRKDLIKAFNDIESV
jgi:CBS domain-containing protein